MTNLNTLEKISFHEWSDGYDAFITTYYDPEKDVDIITATSKDGTVTILDSDGYHIEGYTI